MKIYRYPKESYERNEIKNALDYIEPEERKEIIKIITTLKKTIKEINERDK